MKKRKIAFISQHLDDVLPPSQNSLGIWIFGVATRLAKENSIRVYVPCEGYKKKRVKKYGVEWVKVPIKYDKFVERYLKKIYQYNSNKKPLYSSIPYFLGYTLQIAYDLNKDPVDIIHTFNFSHYSSVIRKFCSGSKIVLRMSCEWLTQLDNKMIQKRLKNIDLIIGCSDFITNKIKLNYPSQAGLCFTVRNGRDFNRFVPPKSYNSKKNNDFKKILYVGRVSPEKGIHVLIKALNIVIRSYPNIEVKIVGPKSPAPKEFIVNLSDDFIVKKLQKYYSNDSYLSMLKKMTSKELKEKITFEGTKPHNDLAAYYQNADIFVFPSVWNEPSGNPPIEAMAAGLPVISTTTGGTPEYVKNGETGILIRPGNSHELSDAILYLVKNEQKRIEMGVNARKRALEKFTFERLVKELNDCYQNILQFNK